jgi:hypothetical protein
MQTVNAIAGSITTLVPLIGYLVSRSWLKAKTATDVKNG